MKVVHLKVIGTADPPLTLHPQLTVIRGLSPEARSRVVAAVGRLAVGHHAVAAGELEASGVRFDLDDEALAILGLEEPAEGVVTAADLPNGLPVVEVPSGPTSLALRLEALEARRAELQRISRDMGPVTTGGVARALDAVEGESAGETLPEAREAADAWRDLHVEISGVEMITSVEERTAMARVREAEDAVAVAESALHQPLLNPEQIRKIEAAHAAVIEASDRVERRFGSGGARARRQLADAEADERRVLERLGFSTWVDYVLSSAQKSGDPTGERDRAAVAARRRELAEVKAELELIPGATDRVRRRSELQTRRHDLAGRVAKLLGHEPTGPEAEAELRARRAEADREPAMADLAAELSIAGIEVDPATHDLDDMIEAAHQLLAVERSADHRRVETAEAITALDAALEALRVAQEAGATAPPSLLALPRLAEPPRSIRELTGGHAEGDDAEPVAPPAPPRPIDRAVLVDDVHWALLEKLAELRTEGPAGQLPLVLDEPFEVLDDHEAIEVLARLARLSDLAQIVVATDRLAIARWAWALGPGHAAVVGP